MILSYSIADHTDNGSKIAVLSLDVLSLDRELSPTGTFFRYFDNKILHVMFVCNNFANGVNFCD